jgi:hypothetical protein
MEKVTFDSLGLSKNEEYSEINLNGNIVGVLKYLPVEEKSNLINVAVRSAVIDGIVDEVLADAYLHMFLVEFYTNIVFTGEQKENILATFDILESNGIFDAITAQIDPAEYDYVFKNTKKLTDSLNEYNRGIASLMGNLEDMMSKASGQTK